LHSAKFDMCGNQRRTIIFQAVSDGEDHDGGSIIGRVSKKFGLLKWTRSF
jgi:hypothetical protein